jgi:hypothetical protein
MLDTIFEPQFPQDSILNRQSNLQELTEEGATQKDFFLLPNPYSDQFVISVHGMDMLNCGVTMYVSNLQGQIILTQQLESLQTNMILDNYSTGVFIVSIVDCNKKMWVKKLVKI